MIFRRWRKMKEDELIGKLVKDYRLNDDDRLICVILEDGTEIQPGLTKSGEYCLQISE